MESTLIIIKPDAVKNGHSSDIINRIGSLGYVAEIKSKKISEIEAMELYCEHLNKPFFDKLVSFITSDRSYVIKASKENSVSEWRKDMDSIRREFGTDQTFNAVHGSDSVESSIRELKIFF